MGLIKLRKALLSCLLSFISVVYILRDQRQKHFGCPIKPVPAPYQNVLIFSLLKDTKMAILKPPRQILILHKTAQHGKFIRQKRVSMLNAQILSTPFCFLSVLFLPNPPLAIWNCYTFIYWQYIHFLYGIKNKSQIFQNLYLNLKQAHFLNKNK